MVRIVLLLLYSISASAQKKVDSIRTKDNVPIDILSAVKILNMSFSEAEKTTFKNITKDSIVSFFWDNGPEEFWYQWNIAYPKKSPIAYFQKLGLNEPSDIYKAIIIS